MPIIVSIIVFLLGASLGEIEIGLAFGAITGLVLLRREYQQKVKGLQQQLDQLKQQWTREPQDSTAETKAEQEPQDTDADFSTETAAIKSEPAADDFEIPRDLPESKPSAASRYIDRWDEALRKVQQVVVSYFTDGNIFVRVGLLILFFGIAFLLKYAAENSKIPLEFRFLGAAAGGLFLLVMGWRLRFKKVIYALLLQGGGIGIIYITIFASYRLADLMPSSLTFFLLVLFAVFSAALAVLQNSRTLAIFAVLGGFLAPLLASTGSGNFIGLFSYYALLNLSIFIIAWFKSWRLLNVIGFVFTFAVYSLWFINSYQPENLYPALGFLLLFFLMYSSLGLLYALKQQQNLRGLVDGTLVFGTPVIASSLMMAMVRHLEYGIALTAALLGLYYVIIARLLWQKQGEQLRLLSEALLAIGVVFATLAIPYALDGHWTSATWALEAAGILWISIRQQRRYAQWFAIVLQFGAGLLFLARNVEDFGDTAWLNPAFLGGVFIALGAFISARLLYKLPKERKIRRYHLLFYLWAMVWWLGSALAQIDEYMEWTLAASITLFVMTAMLLTYLDRIRQWQWKPAAISSAALLPILILIALSSLLVNDHFLVFPDVYFWIAGLAVNYWILVKLEAIKWPLPGMLTLHIGWLVLVGCLFSYELTWFFYQWFPQTGPAYMALAALLPLFIMHWSRLARIPVITRFGTPMQIGISLTFAVLIALGSLLVNIFNTAGMAPLPYFPIANAIDLAHLAFFAACVRLLLLTRFDLPHLHNPMTIVLGALVFIWLSAVLLRSMHHYAAVPFDLSIMLVNVKIQTALSILWTIIGMLAMLIAARKSLRPLWIAGAVLISVVLVKMFFIDLGASGTVERIVSFLVVGGLLVAMGYFSPIPDRIQENKGDESSVNDKNEADHV